MTDTEYQQLYRLDGAAAVVTGAAQGLGREIALALAQSGADLALTDVASTAKTASLAAQVGARCIELELNVTDEASVEKAVGRIHDEFGRVDVLVNNAGLSQMSFTPSQDLPLDEWNRILSVNLTGTFLCCKHFGRIMIDQKQGRIVNVASTASFTGVVRAPAYAASKAGVALLTKSLALEWAPYGVRVNAVAPHYLETGLTESLRQSDKVHAAICRQIPLGRFGQTSEAAAAALYLASAASSYTTGSIMTVDGGYLAQ